MLILLIIASSFAYPFESDGIAQDYVYNAECTITFDTCKTNIKNGSCQEGKCEDDEYSITSSSCTIDDSPCKFEVRECGTTIHTGNCVDRNGEKKCFSGNTDYDTSQC